MVGEIEKYPVYNKKKYQSLVKTSYLLVKKKRGGLTGKRCPETTVRIPRGAKKKRLGKTNLMKPRLNL